MSEQKSGVVTLTVSAEKLEKLKELLCIPHDHYDGQNECSICDQNIIEAALQDKECANMIESQIKSAAQKVMRRMVRDDAFYRVMHGTDCYSSILEAYAMSLGKDFDELECPPSMMPVEDMWNWLHAEGSES